MRALNIVVLGAAYGLLPAMRCLSAGHNITVICRPDEQRALIDDGAKVTFSASGQVLSAAAAYGAAPSGVLGVSGAGYDVSSSDLAILAMSEPHFSSPEIVSLIRRIAAANIPVLSISNTPPPAFLSRLNSIDAGDLKDAFVAWATWQHLDPALVTSASPDAQAVRRNPAKTNELTVTLGSNFKVAPFERPQDQAMLEGLARDVAADRQDGETMSARFIAHSSLHVPLSKWPMLLTGNCRCLQPDVSIIPIAAAVNTDKAASEQAYQWTLDLVRRLGAKSDELVPFKHYSVVSRRLIAPSSFARAAAAGVPAIERIDKMIQLAGRSFGLSFPELDRIVEQTDTLVTAHGDDRALA